jgi:ElaB/YqjD/DUF883 family membrane-anchored ribosome-binding protein
MTTRKTNKKERPMLNHKEKEKTNHASGKKVADDARHGAYRVVSDVDDTLSSIGEDVKNMAHNAGQRFREFADSAEDAKEAVTTKISDNPMSSALIALGIGFLIGNLFRR